VLSGFCDKCYATSPYFLAFRNFGGIVSAPYGWEDLLMETRKLRHAIIAALASFFALSLAFAGEDESAIAAEEEAAMEAPAEDTTTAEAAKEETAAEEEEEEEEEEAE
jgi:hypothetical protein